MAIYCQYNYLQLEPLVCDEDPWRRARQGTSRTEHSTAIISQKLMLKYYQYLLDIEHDEEVEVEEEEPEPRETACA